MDNLNKLQKLTLGFIIALVWFLIMCFVVIFVGNIFKWSFLSETFSVGFFSAFGVGLGALIALAILNITLTFNSISHSLFRMAANSGSVMSVQDKQKSAKLFKASIFLAIASILGIVLFLWCGEVSVNRHKIKVSLNSLEAVAKSPLADKLVDLINKDATVKEVLDVRDAMRRNLEEKGGLSLLVPINKIDSGTFYEVTPWWYQGEEKESKPISQANLRVFVPYTEESIKFNELIKNKKPFYSINRYQLRVFYPIVVSNKVVCIVMLDTSRQASDQYLWKRSSSQAIIE
ncbi:MAG: hypothetical protein WCI77_07460 [Candidatus Omnitrophota bacterium]